MREMTVFGVSLDLRSKQPIVLLKTSDADVFVPVWVGAPEAAAIVTKLQEVEPPRPMTHDLAWSLVETLGGEITRVTVTELRDNTFHATITVQAGDAEVNIDSRTSDAIALALRADAPIFAADEVVDESGVEFEGGAPSFEAPDQSVELGEVEVDLGEFRKFLDSVTPDEFATGSDSPAPGSE